jgi:hypothetical protein
MKPMLCETTWTREFEELHPDRFTHMNGDHASGQLVHLDGAPLSAFAMEPIRLARSVRRADMLADADRSVTSYTDAGSRQ